MSRDQSDAYMRRIVWYTMASGDRRQLLAAADVDASKDRQQGNIVAFLQQVAVVEEAGIDGAGACYLVLTGAHGADLRIVVCIATDGRAGWALV